MKKKREKRNRCCLNSLSGNEPGSCWLCENKLNKPTIILKRLLSQRLRRLILALLSFDFGNRLFVDGCCATNKRFSKSRMPTDVLIRLFPVLERPWNASSCKHKPFGSGTTLEARAPASHSDLKLFCFYPLLSLNWTLSGTWTHSCQPSQLIFQSKRECKLSQTFPSPQLHPLS